MMSRLHWRKYTIWCPGPDCLCYGNEVVPPQQHPCAADSGRTEQRLRRILHDPVHPRLSPDRGHRKRADRRLLGIGHSHKNRSSVPGAGHQHPGADLLTDYSASILGLTLGTLPLISASSSASKHWSGDLLAVRLKGKDKKRI